MMGYLLIRKGKIIKVLEAIDGSSANRLAREEGGIAVLIVGKQAYDEVFDHVLQPLASITIEEIVEGEEFISEGDIERIIRGGGVEVTAEKIDGNDQDD